MIELVQVSKSFNCGQPNEFLAVNNVTLTIQPKLVTVLKGPSGSGKTSLLSLIGCMSRPTSGRILLSGIDTGFTDSSTPVEISGLPERFLAGIRRKSFGFIFQQFNLFRGVSVIDNVMLPALPCGDSHKVIKERALALLERFRLTRHENSLSEWLSGGEMQRVAIARALINNPELIIADEPTAHLDSKLSAEFMELAQGLKEDGKTIIIASHDPIVYDNPIINRVVTMRDGTLCTDEGR